VVLYHCCLSLGLARGTQARWLEGGGLISQLSSVCSPLMNLGFKRTAVFFRPELRTVPYWPDERIGEDRSCLSAWTQPRRHANAISCSTRTSGSDADSLALS